jgi:hypothetical protein
MTARWATLKEAAVYMRCSDQHLYNSIYRKTKLGELFTKGEYSKRVVDLNLIDSYLRGTGK